MPRAIWTGAISFGLVSVPVKLYSAVARKTVRFHQLHAADGVRIQQKRVCPADGEEVPYEEIVKGYEIAPDRYVVIEPEELEALDPKKTRTIDIEDFVDLSEIDPIFYDHPYYLVPGAGGAKPYRLLVDAMRETNKVAIARVVIRSKEQLVALRPMGDVLAMATMVFADEIVPPERLDELPDAAIQTTERELAVARQLVESLAGSFEPEKYHDTYREEVLELIERKAHGEEIAVQPPREEPATEVPDLMSALQASLEEVRRRTGPEDGKAARPRRPARRTQTRAGSGRGKGSNSRPANGAGAKESASGTGQRRATTRTGGSGKGRARKAPAKK
ncbi:MAG TPA: Ku protein [Solirubrobacteraceae bacterium]|jgi:DNA end-binding protein Ku|nr:Ku protein [Solirubrobacteraceae bacterium]